MPHWTLSGDTHTSTFGYNNGGLTLTMSQDYTGAHDGHVDIGVDLHIPSGRWFHSYRLVLTTNGAGDLSWSTPTITLSTLKSVVAASTDFADFQSRIAAL